MVVIGWLLFNRENASFIQFISPFIIICFCFRFPLSPPPAPMCCPPPPCAPLCPGFLIGVFFFLKKRIPQFGHLHCSLSQGAFRDPFPLVWFVVAVVVVVTDSPLSSFVDFFLCSSYFPDGHMFASSAHLCTGSSATLLSRFV